MTIYQTLTRWSFLCITLFSGLVEAADIPKLLSPYFKLNEVVKGEIVVVVPPEEIKEYIKRFEEAAQKDPKWFDEYSANSKAGVPLPYHEKLGLSEEEYKNYRKLWDSRKFETVQEISLRFEKDSEKFLIRATGGGSKISLLRYDPKSGNFSSPNGVMNRLEDIDADPDTILGAWTGHEWRYEEKTGLGTTKENVAIGQTKGQKTAKGMLVYRLQDVSSTGRVLFDKTVLIRFDLPQKGK